jgi:tetratricopeptide (TPR) repeat protein
LRLLAQTKTKLQKYSEAVEIFKRVIELNPTDMEANIEIAQLYEQTDFKTALVYYEKALKIARSDVEERKLSS